MIWCGIFQKAAIFVTCPLFSTVMDVCQGGLTIVVCQGVQTSSTDIFGKSLFSQTERPTWNADSCS